MPQTKPPGTVEWVQGGNVPGGHLVFWGKGQRPFVPGMDNCNSIALRHSDIVVDIGAYVGTFALRCARFPVQQVVAYEPTPRSAEVLERTRLPNLRVCRAAIVGDDRTEVELFISSGLGVANTILPPAQAREHTLVVPAVNYVEAVRGASVVKIDIEGGEYDLPIVQPSLRAVIIDFHPLRHDASWPEHAQAIIQSLLDAGFTTVMEPVFDLRPLQLKRNPPAGSWQRPLDDSTGECTVLMQGVACCGCGVSLRATGHRTLCHFCFQRWLPRHRQGYRCSRAT